MEDFISGTISEKDILKLTPLEGNYETFYLCSAPVLSEFRRKGIARKLTMKQLTRSENNTQ